MFLRALLFALLLSPLSSWGQGSLVHRLQKWTTTFSTLGVSQLPQYQLIYCIDSNKVYRLNVAAMGSGSLSSVSNTAIASAPPATPTLSQVLTAGNSATGQSITNVNEISGGASTLIDFPSGLLKTGGDATLNWTTKSLANPLGGGWTTTTQSAGDNSTKIATTAYVDGLSAGYVPTSRQLTINGSAQTLAADRTWTITTTGTSNRISVSGGTGLTPTIDIAGTYVGQSSITTLGTIGTGVWNGSVIPLAYGGTNANLTADNGGMFYSTGAAGAILASTATAGKALVSGASTTPSWFTPTTGRIVYSTTGGALTTNAAFVWDGTKLGVGVVPAATVTKASYSVTENPPTSGSSQAYSFVRTMDGTTPNVSATYDNAVFGINGTATTPAAGMLTSSISAYTSTVITKNVLALSASFTNQQGNSGSIIYSYGTTTGMNLGGFAEALNGNRNIGYIGKATTAKASTTNIGLIGVGRNSNATAPIEVGVFAYLGTADSPTFESGALIADNGSTTNAIFKGRDNGTTTFQIADGGIVTAGYTTLLGAERFGVQSNQNANSYALLSNTTSGTAGKVALVLTNSGSIATQTSLESLSAAYTTAGIFVQDASVLYSSKAGGLVAGTAVATNFMFYTNNAESMRLTTVKNLKIAGTAARATTEGTNHLDIFDGTAPVGTLANGISLYSTAGELRVMDAAGNATLLSPHDSVTNEWIYYCVSTQSGKVLRIDMERMMKKINDTFGWDFVHETTVDGKQEIGGTQVLTPTSSPIINLTADLTAQKILAKWNITSAQVVNVLTIPKDGAELVLVISNSSGGNYGTNFGALLVSSGSMSIGNNKKGTIRFIASNGVFVEQSRSTGLQ